MTNILITGANEGIGYYFVEKCLQDGRTVAVLDRSGDRLQALRDRWPGRLLFYPADVRDGGQVQRAADDFAARCGPIDVAVHNACFCPFESAAQTPPDDYARAFAVNYSGALHLARAVLPAMQRRGRGRVAFTVSGVGVTGFPGLSAYASTKGALEALAKCLALEYAADGITFHLLHPPLTRTRSAAPLPVPDAFKADPAAVGYGLARHIFSRRFLICPSIGQRWQMLACYLFPLPMGRLMARMTARCSPGDGPYAG